MTPVITAAMSKLIKVVGSLSYFHVEAHVAQRRYHRHRHGGVLSVGQMRLIQRRDQNNLV